MTTVNSNSFITQGKDDTEFARLQVKYNAILKENALVREKEAALKEEVRYLNLQLTQMKKSTRDLKSEQTNFY